MTGSISRGKNDPSQSLQMVQRPLMTADELKAMPKGQFIVSKTGYNPMRSTLKLFRDWGIKFEKSYKIEEKSHRKVAYADKRELEAEIIRRQAGEPLIILTAMRYPMALHRAACSIRPLNVRMELSILVQCIDAEKCVR
jgi:type IV secretory pathway TraG/TraD family ATPase VirD4